MAYEESYFFGKCNVVCEAETTADNGKTVTITDGTNSFTGTIVNRVASFFIPGKTTYTVTLSDGGTTEWTGTIAAGYGENIHVMLADGYESIKEKQIMSAQEIAAATAGTLGNAVPDADALKSLNENLTDLTSDGDIVSFSVGADEKPYITYKVGADTVTKKLGDFDVTILKFSHPNGQFSGGVGQNDWATIKSVDLTPYENMTRATISFSNEKHDARMRILDQNDNTIIQTGSYNGDVDISGATSLKFQIMSGNHYAPPQAHMYIDISPIITTISEAM